MQSIKPRSACLEHIIHVEMANTNPSPNPNLTLTLRKHAHLGLTGCRNSQRSQGLQYSWWRGDDCCT